MGYEYVKTFRKKIKEALVKAFGGKCPLCEFNKYNEGFAFHHIDPSKKEFTISSYGKLNTEKLKEEAKKCVMICMTCHVGIHAKHLEAPKDQVFNESLFDEICNRKKAKKDKCPKCGDPKPVRYKYCSHTCADLSRGKIDWENIDLELWIKTKSVQKIADELNISYNSVKKRLIKLELK